MFRRLHATRRLGLRILDQLRPVFSRPCRHPHPGWPITAVGSHHIDPGHGRQVCARCGSYRFYAIGVGPLSGWLVPRPAGAPR